MFKSGRRSNLAQKFLISASTSAREISQYCPPISYFRMVARESGWLKEILVKPGDDVKAGRSMGGVQHRPDAAEADSKLPAPFGWRPLGLRIILKCGLHETNDNHRSEVGATKGQRSCHTQVRLSLALRGWPQRHTPQRGDWFLHYQHGIKEGSSAKNIPMTDELDLQVAIAPGKLAVCD